MINYCDVENGVDKIKERIWKWDSPAPYLPILKGGAHHMGWKYNKRGSNQWGANTSHCFKYCALRARNPLKLLALALFKKQTTFP